MKKQFFRYVFQDVAGMIGVSVYILADTFFISLCSGADGITVLNLALPIYGVIFAIGAMIGVGAATRHAIKKAQGEKNIDDYFMQAVTWCMILSIPFMLLGLLIPGQVLRFMGADGTIMKLGQDYVRIFMTASPLFMINYVFTAFTRNDNAPGIAMIGSIAGSLFNIIFDYILMFPLGLGLKGAALATIFSPVVTSLVCCIHLFGKKNQVGFEWRVPSPGKLFYYCGAGVSAFVGEIAAGITTAIFNLLILSIAGNVGVAAYGVVANLSLISMAIFNGISQGAQPLLSKSYGAGNQKEVRELLRYGLICSFLVECVLVAAVWKFTDPFVAIFNSKGNQALAYYAHDGLRLYFLGYFIAGINIFLIGFFAATARVRQAFVASMLRGAIAIAICAILMATLWGMNGVWLSFLAAEFITVVAIIFMGKKKHCSIWGKYICQK